VAKKNLQNWIKGETMGKEFMKHLGYRIEEPETKHSPYDFIAIKNRGFFRDIFLINVKYSEGEKRPSFTINASNIDRLAQISIGRPAFLFISKDSMSLFVMHKNKSVIRK